MTESPTPYVLDADTMTGGMRPIRQAVIALGSNLGERLQRLQGGVAAIEDTPEVKIVAISSVYETDPVDSTPDSGPYLNAVVLIDTTLTVHQLLDRALAIEDAFGRDRTVKNAPRTLDVDLKSRDAHIEKLRTQQQQAAMQQAATAAPELMPPKRPSSLCRRRAHSKASSSVTSSTSSTTFMFRFLGMKPAPMPWIL